MSAGRVQRFRFARGRLGRLNAWTAAEDTELCAHWWGDLPRREIAFAMRRTEDAIQLRANTLGLPSRSGRVHTLNSNRHLEERIAVTSNRDDDHVSTVRDQGGFPAYDLPRPAVRLFHDGERMRRAYG